MNDKLIFVSLVIGSDVGNYSWCELFKNVTPEEIHDLIKDQIERYDEEIFDITLQTKHYGFEEDEFLDNYYEIIYKAV